MSDYDSMQLRTWDIAQTEYREKSRAYALICDAYRAKEIGETEFLAARTAINEARAIVNTAYCEFTGDWAR